MFALASVTMTPSFQGFSPLSGPFIGSIGNVFPRVAANNPSNRCGRDSVTAGEGFLCDAAPQLLFDGDNIVFRKLSAVVVAAMRHVASPLRQLIGIVFRPSAKPQVVRIDAPLNVARMANAHTFRNRPVNVLVHNAVSALYAAIKLDLPVAKDAALLSVPNPATFLLLDLVPKSLRKLFHGGEYSSATAKSQMVNAHG